MRALYVLLLLALAAPVAAQQDILTGRVTTEDGKPVIGARVEVISAETEITRSVVTDNNGRYMMVFPDGGGRYVMRITFLGLADHTQAVVRNDTEELLLTNIVMKPRAIVMDAINVTAQRPPPAQGGATGEQSTALTQEMLNRLPLPDLDPSTLALLAAGVVGTGADSLSGRLGFSVGGMSDLLNQITLDGVVLGADGALGVPTEGVRRTQVTTSTFDPSRGGFAGGQVSMQTARGNNRKGGSLSYTLDDDALQLTSSASSNPFTRHKMGGSWGGPIIQNRLFYNTSFELGRNTNYMFALTPNDPLAAQRSGVAPDSIGRFIDLLQNRYGFEDVLSQTGAYTQPQNDYRLQGRLDWNLLQRQGTSQTLSLSYNTNVVSQENQRISTVDLTQHGGEREQNSQLARLSLSSRWGSNWTNNLSLSFSENWSEQLPYDTLPEGRVRVTSEFEDGTRATNSLVFGGNRSMPTEAYARDIQVSEDLSFLLPVGAQLHRLKVGGSMQLNKDVSRSTSNLFGSFSFASLEDFEANRPDSYTRALQERNARTGSFNGGLYLGDTWRVSMPLELTLGLRYDYSRLDQKPDYNPLIEEVFGRRTDITPDAWSLSPRVGFNYRLNQQGQAPRTISGGIGMFAGRSPISVYSTAVRQTGLPSAEQSLTCIGAATPIPDWDLYASNPNAVPTECLDGSTGGNDPLSQRAPTVTLIDPDQALPSSLRADIGYRTQLPKNFTGNFRYTYSLGMGLWGYRDLNLDESQTFTIGGENRTFFGDPSAIVTRTGATSMVTSRNDERFGNVWDVVSELESRSHQVTAQVNGALSQKLFMNVNYTLGWAKDQGSGSFQQATTAGNPNRFEWATSSNDRRHTLNLMAQYALTSWMEVSANARLSSGTPFTPLVNRDINGDGARNDRAFIFDPSASADTAVANGMSRLLATVPGAVRDCLDSQLGQIADRNSCRNNWTESLDMRLSLRPNLPTLQRRLTLSLDTRNMLTGLDQVVNGKNSMKGWGEGARADANLLEVRGFDPATNSYLYQVNEGFGQTRRGPGSFRAPFSITFSGRIAVGGQPQMNNRGFGQGGFGGGFGGGPGGGGRGGFGGPGGGGPGGPGMGGLGEMMGMFRGGNANVDSLLAAQLSNPIAELLTMKDSLQLTDAQLASIDAASKTLDGQLLVRRTTLKPTIESLMASVMQQGGGGNPQQIMQQVQLQVQPHLEGARRETAEAAAVVQRELSAAQWAKVPARVRQATQAQQRGGSFNGVAMLDRMLANPLPVLLDLKTQLAMTPEQVAQVEKISNDLSVLLAQRREELGRRFDNVQGQQQGQVFQQIQPDIEKTRKEVTDAIAAVQKILTAEQWSKVPDQVKTPFQQQQNRGGGRGNGGE